MILHMLGICIDRMKVLVLPHLLISFLVENIGLNDSEPRKICREKDIPFISFL